MRLAACVLLFVAGGYGQSVAKAEERPAAKLQVLWTSCERKSTTPTTISTA